MCVCCPIQLTLLCANVSSQLPFGRLPERAVLKYTGAGYDYRDERQNHSPPNEVPLMDHTLVFVGSIVLWWGLAFGGILLATRNGSGSRRRLESVLGWCLILGSSVTWALLYMRSFGMPW